jgi:hypothetical protein
VTPPEPSYDDVHAMLQRLLDGSVSPADAAGWANQWVLDDDAEVHDPATWQALDALAGADIETEPGELLHSDVDYRQWLEELEASRRPQPGHDGDHRGRDTPV